MAEGENMNVVPEPPEMPNSLVSPQQNQNHSYIVKLRRATLARIFAIVTRKLSARKDSPSASQQKYIAITKFVEHALLKMTTSLRDYSDPRYLELRVEQILRDHRGRALSSHASRGISSSSPHQTIHATFPTSNTTTPFNNLNFTPPTFQSGGGFPISNITPGSDLQRHHTANYHQMVEPLSRPNNTHQFTTSITSGICTTKNTVPLPPRPLMQPVDQFQAASQMHRYFMTDPLCSTNLYGVAQDTIPLHPNPMPRVDANPIATNHSNPLLLRNTSFQSAYTNYHQNMVSHGFHQQHQGVEHSHPGQFPKQDPLLPYKDAYQTQPATPGPSLDIYKEALQQHANNPFKPSKLPYQHNALAQHQYFGTHLSHATPLGSSPSFPPPPRNQSASVLLQRPQSSLQNSAQLSETNSNGDREHVVVNLCQTTPTQPQVFHHCSSAIAPVISAQAVSALDGKQVNGEDGDREIRDQRRWILFMIHARTCSATEDKCASKHCSLAKKLVMHTERCKIPDCTYPRCQKTKRWLLHCNECKDKSCPVCVYVKEFYKKKKSTSLQAYKKRGNADDNLQPSIKRLKIDQPSQNTTPEMKSNSSSVDDCKSEVKPMDIDVPVTRELEKHVAEDKTICLDEVSAPKEQNVEVVDESKMEISSLVELFTTEQVQEHIRGLRQWVGQSKSKADKNRAMGCSMSANACQLCGVERLVFEPIPIYCSPCGVRIKRNAVHYSAAAGESRHHVCAHCYNEARENSVSVDGTCIPKTSLEKKKNDEQIGEGWVQCDKCEAWQHQICGLFNSRRNHGEATKYTCPNCYIQEVEEGQRRPLPHSAIPGANSLPVTSLSNHIEQRLFTNLSKERHERARLQGKRYEEVPGAESLAVRVVASVDKVLEVKERFLELFREENYPSEFPYKSKVILLFQKIESVEVCLFGMFVQEFGTECGAPNERRVYISYLDSVKYFRPEVRTVSGEALRTFVYHQILIGYLDYCKKRGFTSCYIWACPPLKGEDYILYCHPEIQKTPKTDKLREWYLAMLKKASKEGVVVEYTNLYDQFFVQSGECRANVSAARLPYFDGDYWPGVAEDLLQQMSQEDDDGTTTTTNKLNRKGLTKKVISKRALRAVGQLDLSVNASKDRLMMQKLGEIICPMKEDFIMVHLQHCCKHCCTPMVSGNRWVCNHCKNFQICDKCNEGEQKRAEEERHPINQKQKHTLFPVAIEDVPTKIEEKDENMESEIFDNRQAFLSLCQGNNYQYDTLRRAKHSSMMILYHLHNPTAPAFPTTCTICQQEIENAQGWRCQVCTSYDVCNACYSKASFNHPHDLISRSSATETSVQENGQANQNYQIMLQKIKEVLIHVPTCRSTRCQNRWCHGVKMLLRHCVACKSPAGCRPCKKLWNIIRLHARHCRDSQCTVFKCREFKANSSRQQKQSDKRRRAAVMEMMRKRAAEATHTC
ncbi:unnamed protein product [Microthlaspi erraticum]|uniref:histone acetyltransferase n=1 Tax=Microthlaspi erraticum TaxID=1685480 RepID=A0A6D2IEW8_9BRAS|nr:unnamed protein product [Microthlaspi erraticum]